MAFEDHTNILLDKACQSGNAVFDEFCRTYPAPPILLLVGSAKSNIQELAASLKEKFKYHVMIGLEYQWYIYQTLAKISIIYLEFQRGSFNGNNH